jgi:integrase
LYPWITRYLELKTALGRQYRNERYVFRTLDRFLAEQGSDLSAHSFACWCDHQHHLKSGVRRYRMRIVRNLCLYRQRTEPACFVPDRDLFPVCHQPVRPYLFTDADIVRLWQTAALLRASACSPLRVEVLRLAILLLYTTGLRRNELVRLTCSDYDLATQTLLVRASKFHKSRYLPLSLTTAQALEGYLQLRRRRRLPVTAETCLVGKADGQGYSAAAVSHTLHELFQLADIHTPEGRWPRVHDMRHAFAVNALWRWYRNGEDVQAKLPLLATYMGHVSIVSTAYYLPFVEPLTTTASARFQAGCGELITSTTTSIEGVL